jgi:hypothetical protein
VNIVLFTIVSVHFPLGTATVACSDSEPETAVVAAVVVVVVVISVGVVVVVSGGVVVVVSGGSVGGGGVVVVVVICVREMLVVVSVTVGTVFESIFSQADKIIAADNAIAVKALSFFPKRIIFINPLNIYIC